MIATAVLPPTYDLAFLMGHSWWVIGIRPARATTASSRTLMTTSQHLSARFRAEITGCGDVLRTASVDSMAATWDHFLNLNATLHILEILSLITEQAIFDVTAR